MSHSPGFDLKGGFTLNLSFGSFCIWNDVMVTQIQQWSQAAQTKGYHLVTQKDLSEPQFEKDLSDSQFERCMVKWIGVDGASLHDKTFRYPIEEKGKKSLILERNYDLTKKSCAPGLHLTTTDACLEYALSNDILPWERVRLLFCIVPSSAIIDGRQVRNRIQRGKITNLWKIRVNFLIPYKSYILEGSKFSCSNTLLPLNVLNDDISSVRQFLEHHYLFPRCLFCDAQIDLRWTKCCLCGTIPPEFNYSARIRRQSSVFNINTKYLDHRKAFARVLSTFSAPNISDDVERVLRIRREWNVDEVLRFEKVGDNFQVSYQKKTQMENEWKIQLCDPLKTKDLTTYYSLTELSKRPKLRYLLMYEEKVKTWSIEFIIQLAAFSGYGANSNYFFKCFVEGSFAGYKFNVFQGWTEKSLTLRFGFPEAIHPSTLTRIVHEFCKHMEGLRQIQEE